MASAVGFTCVSGVFSIQSPRPRLSVQSPISCSLTRGTDSGRTHNSRFHSLVVKADAADGGKQSTKPKSIVCADCDGNGAILCSQCKGTGMNSVDHFNGQFKAGGLCWLCRGKRDILCGTCNGAGFIGGFMSTFDE